ncbi:hypothetical protein BCS98_06195 [Vibrio breoganii]|uniref:GIY-YIG nuclease family protein n=1 Tax=Vibrio breoganii TaxID=553239 RepID=UPI000CC39AB6|nr:GIY-YIG nuclease family protein [Vibrio breoganii]PMM89949.1 hypothetical protein BCT44_15825 [Vibrio breoganii]PMO93572.1 hypothetical protein BCS98_06195 [Vibrio breoganii]
MGCIYIAKDTEKPNLCKIGLTKGKAQKRISQTENPHYMLCHEFPAPDDQLHKIESEIHSYFERKYSRLPHLSSNRKSEWFECNADEAYDVLCSGVVPGIIPVNAKTREKLDKSAPIKVKIETTQKDKANVDKVISAQKYFLFHIKSVPRRGVAVSVPALKNKYQLDAFKAYRNVDFVNDPTRNEYFYAIPEKALRGSTEENEAKFLKYLETKFTRKVEGNSKTNVFDCAPCDIYRILTTHSLDDMFPVLLERNLRDLLAHKYNKYVFHYTDENYKRALFSSSPPSHTLGTRNKAGMLVNKADILVNMAFVCFAVLFLLAIVIVLF